MALSVSDHLSNANEQIEFIATALASSGQRLRVFDGIYRGKAKTKSVKELATTTQLTTKQVLTAGKFLAHHQIVGQTMKGGGTAYEKIDFYAGRKNQILRLARNPKKISEIPTKRRAAATATAVPAIDVRVTVSPQASAKRIMLDDVESFSRVRDAPRVGALADALSETAFKEGVKSILGESGEFKDWGGEICDLSTANLLLGNKRMPTAFAFKGPGTSGKLTPGKMGKNGDQLQRLVQAPCRLFVVQYVRQIDDSVPTQLELLALARSSFVGVPIQYMVIDGWDSQRLVDSYPEAFA
ncbi:MAG: hypothetical protein WD557_16540 [Dehalococcoidia bacterium]